MEIAVNEKRILEEFIRLSAFDAETYNERDISEYLKQKLHSLGIAVMTDHAKEKMEKELGRKLNTASNIYGYLPGNGDPVLFLAHMDTVSLGKGKKVCVDENGIISSGGDTVLGADDISGIVDILEGLALIREYHLPHPDIELVFTVAEETYCHGSKFLDYRLLKARRGYVLDLAGAVGLAALAAPSIISFRVEITGKAAHAGFAPEEGINALSIAAAALSKIPTGHIDGETTVNFGMINGGAGINIVPEKIVIEGEVRSLAHDKAIAAVKNLEHVFSRIAKEQNGTAEVSYSEHIRGFRISEKEEVARSFQNCAAEAMGETVSFLTTYGGSDANRLNENGIPAIVLACGMNNCHSAREYTDIKELVKAAKIVTKLMTYGG